MSTESGGRTVQPKLLRLRPGAPEAPATIDTTGQGLHCRGYRTEVSQGPLKETIAAALVLLSFWKPDRPLLDPFCGTGTIPIEAARIGHNIASGIARSFTFESWPTMPVDLMSDLRSQAIGAQVETLDLLQRFGG